MRKKAFLATLAVGLSAVPATYATPPHHAGPMPWTVAANAPSDAEGNAPEGGGRTSDPSKLGKSEIRDLQAALNKAGYNAGPVDGVWGASTKQALVNFQKAKGISASGRLDRQTVLALGLSTTEFAPAANPPDHRSLQPDDIRRIQAALNQQGFGVGPADGQWGAKTRQALRHFQKSRGLKATGEVDRETILALGFSAADFAGGAFGEPNAPPGGATPESGAGRNPPE